ncbi:hypothetical protein D3C73_1384350 [compost metagenome]
MIRADTEGAEGKEPTVGQLVRIQQQLFAAFVQLQAVVVRARAAVMAGILVAGGGACVIQVRAPR